MRHHKGGNPSSAVRLTLWACILLLTSAAVAFSQVGITFGTEYGIGGIVRVGPSALKVEVGGGVAPLLFFVAVSNGKDVTKFYLPAMIGGKINIRANDADVENRLGITMGANYNELLGAGVGGGIDYQIGISPVITLGGGLTIFPDAESRLLDRFNQDEHTSYDKNSFSAPLAMFQPFISISVLFGK